MKDKGGRAFLLFSSVLCVILFAIAGCLLISGPPKAATETVSEYTLSHPNPLSETTQSQEAPTESPTAAPTDTAGVAGEIKARFLDPYTANTVYNRICVNNKTADPLDIPGLLKEPLPHFQKNGQPQILIIHTHTTECYLPESREYYTENDLTRTGDNNANVVAIGTQLSKQLNEAGFVTLHDATVHDNPYTGSYKRSAATVKKILSENPSILLVIDLHRDSIGSQGVKTKPLQTVKGQPAAQVMLVMGNGQGVAGFENWTRNVGFALKYQQTMEVLSPGLARSMTFLNATYNQNLSPVSLLLEVGTEANSLEEALYGGQLAGNALISLLNTLVAPG